MKRCLILAISILFSVFTLSAQECSFPQANGQKRNYSVGISYKGMGVQGIMVVKRYETGYRCSLINEFGIKAFDFEYDAAKGRAKVSNTIQFLDKWYIRRVIKRDLKRIFKNADSIKMQDSVMDLSHLKLTIDYKIKTL